MFPPDIHPLCYKALQCTVYTFVERDALVFDSEMAHMMDEVFLVLLETRHSILA